MLRGAVKVAMVPALLGAVAGAGFGHEWAWLWVLPALVALLRPLTSTSTQPLAAATRVGWFAAGMVLGGHVGCVLGAPDGILALAIAPWLGLALAQGLSAALAAGLAFAACRSPSARLLAALPALWVLHEACWSWGELAMPWLRLGLAQAPAGPLAGALPWGGVLLASGLTCTLAGMLALALSRDQAQARKRWIGKAVALVVVAGLAGQWQWTRDHGSLPVALLQSGQSSLDRVHAQAPAVQDMLVSYLAEAARSPGSLLVTSETAVPKSWDALPERYLDALSAQLAAQGSDALIGLHLPGRHASAMVNGQVALGASGLQFYGKHQLFPFGEFLPGADLLKRFTDNPKVQGFRETGRAEPAQEPLSLVGHRAAVAVCFEAAFGEAWRRQALSADLLINPSNDSALLSPQLSRQAQQMARLRALELQKPVLRVSDVAGTLVIDHQGQLVAASQGAQAQTVRASVATRVGLTPYGRWGDVLPLGLALLALAGAVLSTVPAVRVHRAPQARTAQGVARVTGQVLPAAVGLLLVIAGMFYLMANSGQMVTEKIRATNAADAAAYSAGVLEARALNFDAYLNRAMVANEIAIAQMVSLASWLNYFATGADNYGANAVQTNFFVLPDLKVAVLDVAFAASNVLSYYTGTTAQEYADYIITYALGPIITANNAAVVAMSVAQSVVQLNLTAGVRQQQIANEVVKAMDPALSAEVVVLTHGFDFFTKAYSDDERGRFADVTMRSRDPFTRERNWTASGFDIPFVRADGALKKRGGTELIGYDEWRAVDTLELHGKTWGCGKFGLSWCDDIQQPIGWGAVEVDAGGGDQGHGYHGNAYNENSKTASKADDNITSPTYAYFTGLPTSRDLKDLDPAADRTTGVTVLVTKSHASTMTSGGAAQAKPSGKLALFNDQPAGGKLAALSRAQVFFDRISARADGKTEIGSLYNPYWRVRLVAPTLADRAYAATKQGGLLIPSLP